MVRLNQDDYEVVMAALSASLRKLLRADSNEVGDSIIFGDDVAADVYEEVMSYVSLHGFDRDYNITPQGRRLELIGDSIFDQSGG